MNVGLLRSIRRALLLIVALAATSWAPRASATCIADPIPALMWSYPAHGDTGVPTNTRVWLYPRKGVQAVVVLDGTPLDKDDGGFVLPRLEPNTTYMVEIHLEALGGAGSTESLSFTTGSSALTEAPCADASIASSSRDDNVSYRTVPENAALCDSIHALHCYDTGQNTVVSFDTSSSPLFWRIGNGVRSGEGTIMGSWWPGSCGPPEVVLHPWGDCMELQAVNAAGMRSDITTVCLSGCRGSAPSTATGFAGLLLAWAVRRRRMRR